MLNVPLRNRIRSVVAGVFRRRMIHAKDEMLARAGQACAKTQQETLRRLLELNADSRFSTIRGLNGSLSVDAFRRRMPVSDYREYVQAVEMMARGDHQALLGSNNPLLMYAVTSGTTSASKLIPVTRQFVSDYRRGWQHWGMGTFQAHPKLSLLRVVQITSSHDRELTEDGTPCGNISGLASSMQKKVVQKMYSVPNTVAEIDDTVLKRQVTATFALADPWVGMIITANPSTLLQLMEIADESAELILKAIHDGDLSAFSECRQDLRHLSRCLRADPRRSAQLESILKTHDSFRPTDCWQEMACLGVWSGGSAASYTPRLRELFGDVPIRDHGLHASEGRMTIPFEDGTASGLLDIDAHFFEFIPYDEGSSRQPEILQAHELEEGREYFILLTTSSGFYRYNIRDVVRCTGFHGTTPRLRFMHKGTGISSITGEKITESQVVAAVQTAVELSGIRIGHFTLTPEWGEPPGYRLYIESLDNRNTHEEPWQQFAALVDQSLRQRNCEYDDKRSTDRLRSVRSKVLSKETWTTFQKRRLARSGGSPEQYKHPFLMPDSEFEGRFLSVIRDV